MVNYVFKSFYTVQICDVSYIHLQTDRTTETERKTERQAIRQAGR